MSFVAIHLIQLLARCSRHGQSCAQLLGWTGTAAASRGKTVGAVVVPLCKSQQPHTKHIAGTLVTRAACHAEATVPKLAAPAAVLLLFPDLLLHCGFLSMQGITEAHLQQTWQAVCSSIISSLQSGRGHKIPALCTVLPSTAVTGADLQAGQQGVKVLLSDQLLKVASQLQLGKGCVHHASVRQQVQGVNTVNTAKLAYR